MGTLINLLKKTLSSRKINEKMIAWQDTCISKQNVICFNLSTNPLLGFEKEGHLYFFRECPPKQNRNRYVAEGIDRFFNYIHNNQVEKLNFAQKLPIQIAFDNETVTAFQTYIATRKNKASFLKKLSGTYVLLNRAGYSIWAEEPTVPHALFQQVGLIDLPPKLEPIATYFIWYMRAMMACLDTQKTAKGKTRYYYNALRAISTEIVAKHLKAEALVTQSTWCRLDIDGDIRYGVLSFAAEGQRAADVQCSLTGAMQRDLISLHVLDALCFQQDHGPNNYNIIQGESAKVAICAFDNDNPNTFFPINRVNMPLAGSAPLVVEGRFQRPYISKDFAEALLQLDEGLLLAELRPWLNNMQLKALLLRLQQLQSAIKNSEVLLLSDEEWDETTLQKELAGEYGKTYLVKLAEQMQY